MAGPADLAQIPRPLPEKARRLLARDLRARLTWQRTLDRWPKPPRGAPRATPFVSIYEGSALRGCFGADEGTPSEKVARAFLRALADDRFGRIGDRQRLAAEIAYVRSAHFISPADALAELELGRHGVGLELEGGHPVVLLPAVARDGRLDATQLLEALVRKAGRSLDEGRLFLFEVDAITARQDDVETTSARAGAKARATPVDWAAAWLERLVQPDGAIVFAIDPRARTYAATGELHHARTSVVLRALAAAGASPRKLTRARQRLERELRAALGGQALARWPSEPSARAGTIAHAVLAGAALTAELDALARAHANDLEPWFGAQVAFALGGAAPGALWRRVVADLDSRPWAPWTCLAARARGDAAVVSKTAEVLARSLREKPPYQGGTNAAQLPETALTALTVEALAGLPAKAAIGRGRAFLERIQLLPGRIPAPIDPALALGALPASPIADILRCDVVGHALLALSTLTDRTRGSSNNAR